MPGKRHQREGFIVRLGKVEMMNGQGAGDREKLALRTLRARGRHDRLPARIKPSHGWHRAIRPVSMTKAGYLSPVGAERSVTNVGFFSQVGECER